MPTCRPSHLRCSDELDVTRRRYDSAAPALAWFDATDDRTSARIPGGKDGTMDGAVTLAVKRSGLWSSIAAQAEGVR